MKVKSVLQADLLKLEGVQSHQSTWVIVMENDPDFDRLGADEDEGDEVDLEMSQKGFTRYEYDDLEAVMLDHLRVTLG